MSGGFLPPLPDLIPIAALLGKSSPGGGGSSRASQEVMGEQRPRRRRSQPEAIDSAGSRGSSAAPQPRKARRRKSDGGRHHRRHASRTKCDSSPERPANPRVNPIFVWIRQEDTRIVDVKCEDYDKRNRILLTKTAQGWRAIPRTETLAPTLQEAPDKHHHRHRRSRRTKVRRKSAAVQVDDLQDIHNNNNYQEDERPPSPTWTSPVNVESHLPSHKIHVPSEKCPHNEDSVNSVNASAHSPQPKCKMPCDVTPLDNLLAVAEFEFNQHMQSGEWEKTHQDDDDDPKDFITNMEHLNSLIESCSKSDDPSKAFDDDRKSDCDYTEDDDNNLAMDDILSRLEQSLRSPDPDNNHYDDIKDDKENFDENTSSFKSVPDLENYLTTSESELKPDINSENTQEEPFQLPTDTGTDLELVEEEKLRQEVESSTTGNEVPEEEDEPTDLSVNKVGFVTGECVSSNSPDELEPTDLSVPKTVGNEDSVSVRSVTPARPQSQNSEAIQSPQPSGIPAVPPSPDIVSTSVNNQKSVNQKSVFLESLLASSTQKIALNSEVTITRQKEPLDLGKCRKSASPTITCSSEEVKNNAEFEPPPSKKLKPDDITLKNLLEVESTSSAKTPDSNKPSTVEMMMKSAGSSVQETPRLLELLKTDSSGPDPLRQLRQILYDGNLNVPDPMLVPKEKLSQIISNPGVEIPKLLKQRPELRLPEALAFPHLLQDPDILVITLQQLETIILKQNQAFNFKDLKLHHNNNNEEKIHEKVKKPIEKPLLETVKETLTQPHVKKSGKDDGLRSKSGNFNELASDIDAATAAAFNQMIWLPYLNQLEAMSFGGNPDVLKMLSSVPAASMYPNQVPDLNHLMGRFPPPLGFPMQQQQQPPVNYENPLEMSMWQEAMMQANMLRPKLPFDGLNPNKNNNSFRDYLDKLSFATPAKSAPSSSTSMANMHKMNMMSKNNMFPSTQERATYHNFLNIPNTFQQGNAKQNLQIPHYNPLFQHQQKQNFGQQKTQNPFMKAGSNKSNYANFYHQQQQQLQQQQLQQQQNQQRSMMVDDSKQNYYHHQSNSKYNQEQTRPKVSCKSFANWTHQQQKQHHQHQHHKDKEFSGKGHQPMDLSGGQVPTGKVKVKQHLIDPANASKLLKHEDVAEVGSTTASIEEMQDAHKHLWHPLFGNQKGHHSPWNWTTVTATGE